MVDNARKGGVWEWVSEPYLYVRREVVQAAAGRRGRPPVDRHDAPAERDAAQGPRQPRQRLCQPRFHAGAVGGAEQRAQAELQDLS